MDIRAVRQYPRIEAFKTLKDAEDYLRKLLVGLQEEAVLISTLYRTFLEGIKAGDEFNVIEILDALPDAGNAGRFVYLTADNKFYFDDGTSWIEVIGPGEIHLHIGGEDDGAIDADAIETGAVTTAKIAAEAITEDKVAQAAITASLIGDDYKILELLNALPDAGTAGRLVFLLTDKKIYRDTGTAWTVLIMPADVAAHIGGTDIPTVDTGAIADAAIETAKIANNAVEESKMAANSISTGAIITGAVTTLKLNALAVTAAKIAALAIETDKLAANAVTADKIAANTITADEIAANAVTAGIILADAVVADKIAANAVTAVKLAASSVETDKLNALAVTAAKIAAHTITAAQIAAGTITADEIAAGAITADEIFAGTITADEIKIGGISIDRLETGFIESFNDLSLGAIHGQGVYERWSSWVTTRDSNTDANVNSAGGGAKYLYLLDNSVSGHVETMITADTGNEMMTGVIGFEGRMSANNKVGYFSLLKGGTLNCGIRFFSNGQIGWFSNGVWTNIQAYSASTWYKIRIHFDCISRYATIFIDDVFKLRYAIYASAAGDYVNGIRLATNDPDVIGWGINNLKIINLTV